MSISKQFSYKPQRVGTFLSKAKNTAKQINAKLLLLIAIPVVAFILVIVGITRLIASSTSSASTDASVQIEKPKATAQINKEFTFSLKDATGKEFGSFTYKLLSAELDKQIVVKGSKATAIDGRIFLIVNLQLTNNQSQGVNVNTRDYVRLTVNGNKDALLAPEIHNDPVEVQAISTKYTRIGFPINESDKNAVLKVGEINGTKTDLQLKFK